MPTRPTGGRWPSGPGVNAANEVYRLYGGMNRSLDDVCAAYTPAELELLADFLRRVTAAGRSATDELGAT